MPRHAEVVLDRTMRTRDMDNERSKSAPAWMRAPLPPRAPPSPFPFILPGFAEGLVPIPTLTLSPRGSRWQIKKDQYAPNTIWLQDTNDMSGQSSTHHLLLQVSA